MSQTDTDTRTPLNLDHDIIEHNAIDHLPTVVAQEAQGQSEEATDVVAAKAVAQQELSKREQARLQRAALLAEQEKLQKLLDEIEDESDDDIAQLKTQVQDLRDEFDRWVKPDDHHVVFAHIGIFCLVASLICWFVSPWLSSQSTYLDGAISSAAVLLAYVAAGLLLFVQTQKH